MVRCGCVRLVAREVFAVRVAERLLAGARLPALLREERAGAALRVRRVCPLPACFPPREDAREDELRL
jgi:hypothetical protein